jgi:hypothetical protein
MPGLARRARLGQARLCRTILHSLEFITAHCARQLPGHCEGIAALDDQDAVRAYARAASGPASMLAATVIQGSVPRHAGPHSHVSPRCPRTAIYDQRSPADGETSSEAIDYDEETKQCSLPWPSN